LGGSTCEKVGCSRFIVALIVLNEELSNESDRSLWNERVAELGDVGGRGTESGRQSEGENENENETSRGRMRVRKE
jgi:hypothetical protein